MIKRVFLFVFSWYSMSVMAAPPQGGNDYFNINMNESLYISIDDLLANDSDPDGDSLQVHFVDDWRNGYAELRVDQGVVVFTPDQGFNGEARFTYVISDGTQSSDTDWGAFGYSIAYIQVSNHGSASPTPTPSPTATATPLPTSTPSPTANPTPTVTPTPSPAPGLPSAARHYFFGHSLVNFDADIQNIPHWLALLLAENSVSYAADGEYRYEDYRLPAQADWWFESVPSAWDSNFASSDYTTVIYTDLNYVQYQPPSEPYCCDSDENHTPINSAIRAYDYVNDYEPSAQFYIYENWPEFRHWPPSQAQFNAYHQRTMGEVHEWWLSLYEQVRYQRSSVKMIPVGPVISKLLSTTPALSDIPATSLYVDNAPHGSATIYFLAALVHYSAIYERAAPADFYVPESIHPAVRENYQTIADFIWSDLQSYQDTEGNSIVF